MNEALVDGVIAEQVPLDDRGLHYGDGLFETLLARGGQVALWAYHQERLRAGARRLRLAEPDFGVLAREVARLAGAGDAVIKIILTRAAGGRGYAGIADAPARRIVSRHVLSPLPAQAYAQGVVVRWCDWRLAQQPALAGLKHLNRLEQVMARSEWHDADIHEGLLRDADDQVICATSANVFARFGDSWVTPALTRAGVAGVCREALLRRRWWSTTVVERALMADELMRADEVFLSNAVRGVVPVARVGERAFAVGPAAREAARHLAGLGFVPAGAEDWIGAL